jgi:hypothetical protein
MRQLSTRDAATTIAYSNDYMLLVFTDGDLHRRRFHVVRIRVKFLVSIDDGLDRVAKELTDDVLEMAENIGERSIKMAIHRDIRDLDVGTIGSPSKSGDGL